MSSTSVAHDAPTVDGTAVEIPHAAADERPTTVALVPRDRTAEVLRPVDAGELEASMAAYQALIPRLLDASDYQRAGGKDFKKKSAWRKLARAFRINVAIVSVIVERDEHDQPVRATAIARATAPNGDFQDGDGYCAVSEPRFAEPKARQKVEHDLPSTAVTRAKNRAIADLIGAGEVSFEEAAATHHGDDQKAWMREATPDELRGVRNALAYLLDPMAATGGDGDPAVTEAGGHEALATAALKASREALGGDFPVAAVLPVLQAARALKGAYEAMNHARAAA